MSPALPKLLPLSRLYCLTTKNMAPPVGLTVCGLAAPATGVKGPLTLVADKSVPELQVKVSCPPATENWS